MTVIDQQQIILWARDFFPWMTPRYAILSVLAMLDANGVVYETNSIELCP